MKLIYSGNIDKMNSDAFSVNTTPSQKEIDRFIKLLRKYELEDHFVVILIDKFVHNKTMAEITRERGFTSPGVTFYLFTQALELLRSKGFKLC